MIGSTILHYNILEKLSEPAYMPVGRPACCKKTMDKTDLKHIVEKII